MSKAKEKALTAEQIFQADDLTNERVEVPEWGGYVIVRTMTGVEKDRFQMATLTQHKGKIVTDLKRMKHFRTRAVSLCAANDKGERIFTEAQVEKLAKKSAVALDRVYSVASRLNGLAEDSGGEAEKNSEPSPDAASTSD